MERFEVTHGGAKAEPTNTFSPQRTLDLQRFCAGHLSVKHSHKETEETIKHTQEFKQEAVRIALGSGLPRARVASDLAIGKSTLGKWLADYRPADLVSAPQADLALENERLRLENRILKEERDILKKATQFFARERP